MNIKFFTLALVIWLSVSLLCEVSFHFAILSDRTGGADQAAFEEVVKDIKNLYPDLVVTVGDIIEDGIYADWDNVLPPLAQLNCPLYFTAGNNDIIDDQTEKYYQEKTGFDPWYSFSYENSHFIVLDNSRYDNYTEMGEEQLLWLQEDLESHEQYSNIFVFMHKPFWAELIAAQQPDPYHEIFLKYNVKAVFTGHWHHYAYENIDGIEYYICGSSGGTFGDFRSDDLAEFYQYLWCYVKDDQLNVTLMKSGHTFSKDQKNLEELDFVYNIPGKYIKTSCSILHRDPEQQNLSVQIINMNDYTMEETLYLKADNWQITPAELPLTIAPGDTLLTTFEMTATGSLLPYPRLLFNYPFGRGKKYQYDKPVFLKRSLHSTYSEFQPVIDGILDEEMSQFSTDVELTDIEGNIDELKDYLTISNNNSSIYLHLKCQVFDLNAIKATGNDQESAILSDDHLGFLFTSNNDLYLQFYLNAQGNIWFRSNQFSMETASNELPDSFKYASLISNGCLQVELEIPYAMLQSEMPQMLYLNLRKHLTAPLSYQFLVPEWSYNSVNNAVIEIPDNVGSK